MDKARSRLVLQKPQQPPVLVASKLEIEPKLHELQTSRPKNSTLLRKYFKYFPVLVISLPFWGALIYLVTHYYPEQVRDVFLKNLFLPLVALVVPALFFTFSFVFLNIKRALWVSLFCSWIIFLQLHQITLTLSLLVGSFIVFGLFEILIVLRNKRLSSPPRPRKMRGQHYSRL